MMSDKFVVSTNEIGEIIVTDVETGKVYDNLYKFFGLIRLMNEQQATIQSLKEEKEQLKKARDESDKFIVKKGLEAEFLNWCVENE